MGHLGAATLRSEEDSKLPMGGLRVVELFAGVGGFRLGLEAAGHQVVWSNQWEPGKKVQWASDCYAAQFGADGHSNQDISTVDATTIPDHDILVGGFPCQDYSVAATLDKSGGIEGKKGVLWWEIVRIVEAKRPGYLLLENVDRLLKSPARQRGRDFAIAIASLANLGYRVEWRVVNAADYGMPQRRRRVFIFAARSDTAPGKRVAAAAASQDFLTKTGFFAKAFPVRQNIVTLQGDRKPDVVLARSLTTLSKSFEFEFQNAGVMVGHKVWTRKVEAKRDEPVAALASILEQDVDGAFFIPESQLPRWKYMKGAKREKRVAKNGHEYEYAEGAIPFPDQLDQPARTLLTGEGGASPSRSNHIIRDPQTGKHRTLTPLECERLNGFPDDWTKAVGMPDRWRYFTMGNALVVGLIARMAEQLPRRRVPFAEVAELSRVPASSPAKRTTVPKIRSRGATPGRLLVSASRRPQAD
jgi:DNA (cytosine-5)-methyltransferase 1